MKNLSLIHPSRSRPLLAFSTAMNWKNKSKGEFEYLLLIDEDDPSIEEYYKLFNEINIIIYSITNSSHSCIEAINKGAMKAEGDVFIIISDDMDCPENWNYELLKQLKEKEDYCVKTDDGHQEFLITLPIMDRKYYNRTKYIYNSIYFHNFADSEMSWTAWMLGRYLKINMKFPHLHHTLNLREKDLIDEKNEKWGYKDQRMFDERKKINFGINSPKPMPMNLKLV